jgi:hypothetical protein
MLAGLRGLTVALAGRSSHTWNTTGRHARRTDSINLVRGAVVVARAVMHARASGAWSAVRAQLGVTSVSDAVLVNICLFLVWDIGTVCKGTNLLSKNLVMDDQGV